jgi:plastocyanin
MRFVTRIGIPVVLIALAVGALGATGMASSHAKGKTAKVKVRDNFFGPTKVKVKKNKKVTWSWGSNGTSETHNVTLKKGPNGVKKSKFTSQDSSSPGFKFTKKFKKPGKYNFVCTIHAQVGMKMKVVVKK